MKERPILMNGAMVRAVLEGRKTQTRRIVKLPKSCSWYHAAAQSNDGFFIEHGKQGYWHVEELYCPYGQPGDRLWVREAFRELEYPTITSKFDYRVSAEWRGDSNKYKWKPSIHMPRWASRITLEITGVRVERLQDISNKDIRAEGACTIASVTHRLDFEELWESINGKGSWDANPWVWVVEFKVVRP